MPDLTVDDILAAGRRGVISLAGDPKVRHYSPDTLALVYERTVANMAGAGSLKTMTERIVADPALKDVPVDVLEVVVAASCAHFARALQVAGGETGL